MPYKMYQFYTTKLDTYIIFEMLAILKGFSKFSNNGNMILIENLFKNLKCLND